MRAKDIVLVGILSASLTVAKLALSFLPNIEIISLLFIIYTQVFGLKKSLTIAFIFSSFEIFIYGFSTWLLGYYIVWPLLIVLSYLLAKFFKSEYAFGILSGLFGYSFGLIFALIESIFYGWAYGLTYWISGLPFDLIHGTSNFILVLILYKPLKEVLEKLNKIYYKSNP